VALGQLAEREGDRRVAEQADRVFVAGVAQERERSGKKQVAHARRPLPARPGHDRRLAPSEGGGVENVVVNESGNVN
jgi:hypothetical protein